MLKSMQNIILIGLSTHGSTQAFVEMPALMLSLSSPSLPLLCSTLLLCLQNDVTMGQLAGTIHPYPTAAECIRQAANLFFKTYRTPAVNKALEILMEDQS